MQPPISRPTRLPSPPSRTPGTPKRIGIERPHETRPIRLHNRHDTLIAREVRTGHARGHVLRAPDGVDVGGVRDAFPARAVPGVLDVVAVVPVRDARLGECGGYVDARADVAEFAVGVACGAPVGGGVGEVGVVGFVGLEVPGVYLLDVVGGEFGELVLEEYVRLRDGGEVAGHEDGAFVCHVAEDRGDFHESALFEESVCVVLDDVEV